MKKTMKERILLLFLTSILTIGIGLNASAKFWGWKITSTTDWADGKCAYRETCKVHYIFWIGGEEQCDTEKIGCIEDPGIAGA